jgi:hypothetical protein
LCVFVCFFWAKMECRVVVHRPYHNRPYHNAPYHRPQPPPPQNPSYYDLEDTSPEGASAYLSELIEATLGALAAAGCVEVGGGWVGGWGGRAR